MLFKITTITAALVAKDICKLRFKTMLILQKKHPIKDAFFI